MSNGADDVLCTQAKEDLIKYRQQAKEALEAETARITKFEEERVKRERKVRGGIPFLLRNGSVMEMLGYRRKRARVAARARKNDSLHPFLKTFCGPIPPMSSFFMGPPPTSDGTKLVSDSYQHE
jgi:hypothetical protein